jgi:hypothetical protein
MLLLEHDVRYSQWWCKRLDEREHLAVCAERVVPSAHLALSPRAEIVPSPVPRPRQPRRRQHLAAGAHARGSRIDINTAHHCSVPGYDARQFAWVVTVYLEILTGKSRGKLFEDDKTLWTLDRRNCCGVGWLKHAVARCCIVRGDESLISTRLESSRCMTALSRGSHFPRNFGERRRQ